MNEKANLNQQIESILFDEDNLDILKNSITSLSKGTLTTKRLKEQIIEFRLKAVQDIVKLFNFYHKQLTTSTSLDEYTKNPNNQQLEQNLQEKNDFIQEIGKRVQNIHSKLRIKLGIDT